MVAFAGAAAPVLVAVPTAVASVPFAASLVVFSKPGVLRPLSKGLPGDLGVLAPNAENAPVPRPKDAPPGDARPPLPAPPGVVIVLKGFLFPCEELSPPNRLGKEFRPREFESLWEEPGVERESLLLLEEKNCQRRSKSQGIKGRWAHTWYVDSIGCYPSPLFKERQGTLPEKSEMERIWVCWPCLEAIFQASGLPRTPKKHFQSRLVKI